MSELPPYPWRMDDPNIAFPIFEKARELGENLLRLHGLDVAEARSRLGSRP